MNQLLAAMGIQDQSLFWTIVFGVIGVIGAAVGLLSWWDGRRTKRVNRYILEVAERNLDKSVTEQQLYEKKAEVEAVSKRMEELQEQIRRDIPIQARRAVLLDRLNSQVELLRRYLNSTHEIRAELAVLGEVRQVPPDLLREIEAEISPEYVLRERRSGLKTQLTIITSAAAIISTLLPYPWDTFLAWPLLIAAIPILILLIRASLPGSRSARQRAIGRVRTWILLVSASCALVAGAFFLLVAVLDGPSSEVFILSITFIIFAVVLGGSGIRHYRGSKEAAHDASESDVLPRDTETAGNTSSDDDPPPRG